MKKFIALLSCMLFILGSIGTVFADENTTVAGSCEFTGKEMVSSFDSNKIAASVSLPSDRHMIKIFYIIGRNSFCIMDGNRFVTG